MVKKECVSCKSDISIIPNSTEFPCPSCGAELVRCGKCRSISAQYRCSKCSFVGP